MLETLRSPARRGPARTAATAWLAAALILGSAPAHADDWADCTNTATDKAAMDRAVVACTAVIASKQRPPTDLPKAYLLRGIANQRTGKLDDAIADFTKALEYDPRSRDALAWRGLARVQAKQFEQAEGTSTAPSRSTLPKSSPVSPAASCGMGGATGRGRSPMRPRR